ncbi:MAG: hypothetical protein ABSE90_11820, partial [Verrucomicrobiota bacterium]
VSDASNINCSIISGNAMNSHTVALTEAQPQVWAFNHNLSPRPAFIRAVLLCTTADSSGAQVGEEYDIWSFYDYTYGTMPFGLYCTAVDIILSYTGTGGVNINYVRAGGIVQNVGDFTHFSIKVYWQ